MPVQWDAGARTAAMTARRDYYAGGTLVLMTAASAVLATFTLTAGGGAIAGDVWTLAFAATTVSATAAGVATKAEIRRSAANGGANPITGLTVATSAADIIIDNTNIANGQQVQVTSATITHAPNP